MKTFIYRILDLLTLQRGIKTTVSGVQLRLPARYFRYYPPDYETDSIRFFHQHLRPGQTVIDIGAQMGLMSKVFADLVQPGGKVYSFEPTPFTFSLLQTTIRINHIGHLVIPVQKAVTEKTGTASLMVSDQPADSANTLSNTKRQGLVQGITVQTTSIDEFRNEMQIPAIHFVKVDAEGAELAVLRGMTRTAQNDRPLINLALHPAALVDFGSSLAEIHQWITDHRYTVLYKNAAMPQTDFISKTGLFDVQLLPND